MVINYKPIYGLGSGYLKDWITAHEPTWLLKSSEVALLSDIDAQVIHRARSTFAQLRLVKKNPESIADQAIQRPMTHILVTSRLYYASYFTGSSS